MLQRGNSLISPHLVQPHQGPPTLPKSLVWRVSGLGRFRERVTYAVGDFPDLVVSKLFGQRVSGGLLQEAVEAAFVVPDEGRHLLPSLLPVVAVADHVVQLMQPGLNTVLGVVPLASHPLHWGQSR